MPHNFMKDMGKIKLAQLIMFMASAMLGIEMWMLMEDLWPHLTLELKAFLFLATFLIFVAFGYVHYSGTKRRMRKK